MNYADTNPWALYYRCFFLCCSNRNAKQYHLRPRKDLKQPKVTQSQEDMLPKEIKDNNQNKKN